MSARAQAAPARSGAAGTRSARSTQASARRRRRLLVVAIALAVVLALAYGVSRSPLLAVDTLAVKGTTHLTTEQVLDAAGVHEGDAMVWIDTGTALSGIEDLPYVRDASLQREWPDTVRITVHERVPAAWVDGVGGPSLVDRGGRVLETVEAAPPGMPRLVGAKHVPPPGGTIDAVGAARVAGALRGLTAVITTSVDVTDAGTVLHLATGPEIRMGDATRPGVKIRAALAVLGECDGKAVVYVDVSVPTNPVAGGC